MEISKSEYLTLIYSNIVMKGNAWSAARSAARSAAMAGVAAELETRPDELNRAVERAMRFTGIVGRHADEIKNMAKLRLNADIYGKQLNNLDELINTANRAASQRLDPMDNSNHVSMAREAAEAAENAAVEAENVFRIFDSPKKTVKEEQEAVQAALLMAYTDGTLLATFNNLIDLTNKDNNISLLDSPILKDLLGADRQVGMRGGAKKKNHILSSNIRGKRKSKKRRYTHSAKMKKSRKKRKSRRRR